MDGTAFQLTRRGLLAAASASAVAGIAARPAIAAPAAAINRLWYRAPARTWVEALPVGNGRISAMVFGGTTSERLQLNEDTLWAGGPYDPANPKARAALPELRRMIFAGEYAAAEKFANANIMATPLRQAGYQTVGSVTIDMPGLTRGEGDGYLRALDLDSAAADTGFTIDGVTYRRRVIASPIDQVIAVQLTASRPGALSLRLGYTTPLKTWAVTADGPDTLVMAGRNNPHGDIPGALRWEARMRALARGGRVTAEGDTLIVEGADEVTLLIAMATSYRRYDDVSGDPTAITRRQIAQASRKSFTQIASAATQEHRRLFRRVAIDLGDTGQASLPTDERVRQSPRRADPGLAALYFQYGRYLLIACSRPGSQPANLQGIWNESINAPWGGKYTININTEMNYWPAQTTALSECVEPLVRMVSEIAETGAKMARDMYGARGWVTHHNTDLWRATAPIDGAKYGVWPTGGAWLCTHLWEHYEYSLDRDFLARVFPILKGASLFFLDTLQTDPRTGHLVTNPSISPELGHGRGSSLIHGPTMDMQILSDLFDQTVAAARVLGAEDDLTRQFAAARQRLLPMKIGAAGQLQEWPEDWDMTSDQLQHRHVSHLYGLYPSRLIDVDRTPALAQAAKRTLEIRGDEATGWATAWRINLWARLRDGERAHKILGFLLGPERTYPNMFDAHPPFQIDGNFGGAAGIVEMVLQNHGDTIELLPALPSAWPSGSIRGLRTRGGCTVDIAWREGNLAEVRITGAVAGARQVVLNGKSRAVRIAPGRTTRLTARDFA